jgi:hypothetical protein
MSLWEEFEPLWWAIISIAILIGILILFCLFHTIFSRHCCKNRKTKKSNDAQSQFKQIRASRDQTPNKQKISHQRIDYNSELRRVLENKPNLKPFVQAHLQPVPDLAQLEVNRYAKTIPNHDFELKKGSIKIESDVIRPRTLEDKNDFKDNQNNGYQYFLRIPSHFDLNQEIIPHSTPIRSEAPLPEAHLEKDNDSTIIFRHPVPSKEDSDVSNDHSIKSYQKGKFRPMIVDGMNIGQMTGGKNFSVQGLRIVFNHLKDLGYENNDIIIIMKNIDRNSLTKYDQSLISKFGKLNVLHWAPQRKVGNDLITSDDNLFILENAYIHEGIVLTKDQYRNHYKKYPKYQDIIKNRMIKPTFINNRLILPVDPLGIDGPKLDDFLRFD